MMKRLTILLAAIALLASANVCAQGVKDPATKNGQGSVMKMNNDDARLYGELTAFTVNGRTTVKVDFNMIIEKIARDKQIFKDCIDLKNYKYANLSEALNVLASHGWIVEHVWTESTRNGMDTKFLISKAVGRMTPVYPWRDKTKEAKGGSRGK